MDTKMRAELVQQYKDGVAKVKEALDGGNGRGARREAGAATSGPRARSCITSPTAR